TWFGATWDRRCEEHGPGRQERRSAFVRLAMHLEHQREQSLGDRDHVPRTVGPKLLQTTCCRLCKDDRLVPHSACGLYGCQEDQRRRGVGVDRDRLTETRDRLLQLASPCAEAAVIVP